MGNLQDTLSMTAGLLFSFSFFPYIRAIWRSRHLPIGAPGKVEPSKASWIIWASLDTMALAGMYAKGTVNGQILAAVCGASTVALLALRYGVSGWTKVDKFCLGAVLLSLALWKAFDNATFGIAMTLIAMLLGSIPTFKSSWQNPSRENRTAWTIAWLSCLPALLGAWLYSWTLAGAGQPIIFFTVETIMMYILYLRPRLRMEVEVEA